MNCLVIGYGSIGKRHARVLEAMGHTVSIVSGHNPAHPRAFDSIGSAFQKERYDYVVISNRTADHRQALLDVLNCGHTGKVLVEKPLFSDAMPSGSAIDGTNVFVGYNLRFHPIIQAVYRMTRNQAIHSIHGYVGQYLPTWRPGTDYRASYSAVHALGGGSLRDLSHEIDTINWVGNGWRRVAAVGGRYSSLEIDSDDVFALLIETNACPVVTLQLNYLDRQPRREMILNLEETSIKADLIANTIEINGNPESMSVSRDHTYSSMHAALCDDIADNCTCTFEQGLEVVALIASAERAAAEGQWISKIR